MNNHDQTVGWHLLQVFHDLKFGSDSAILKSILGSQRLSCAFQHISTLLQNSRYSVETEVHLFSAFTCFGAAYLYSWLQTWISYKLANDFWSGVVTLLRIALSVAGAICMVTCIL